MTDRPTRIHHIAAGIACLAAIGIIAATDPGIIIGTGIGCIGGIFVLISVTRSGG